jgi:methyl-accepting chemotaxis protein
MNEGQASQTRTIALLIVTVVAALGLCLAAVLASRDLATARTALAGEAYIRQVWAVEASIARGAGGGGGEPASDVAARSAARFDAAPAAANFRRALDRNERLAAGADLIRTVADGSRLAEALGADGAAAADAVAVRLPALLLAIDAANPASGEPGPDQAYRVEAAADHVAISGATARAALAAAALPDAALGQDVSRFVASARAGDLAAASGPAAAALADTDRAWRAADARVDARWRTMRGQALRRLQIALAGCALALGAALWLSLRKSKRPGVRSATAGRTIDHAWADARHPQLLAQVQTPRPHRAFQETAMSSNDALSDRLNFMKLSPEVQQSLQAIKPIVMRELPGALDAFYNQIQAFPETRKFFSSQGQMSGAKNRQLAHWEIISSARFDQSYVRAVTTVGEIHARIGLEPRWYIGGYALLMEALIGAVIEARWPTGGFGGKKGGTAKQVSAELGALVKATLLDMDFAISVYLEAAEKARLATEAEVLAKEREIVVGSVGEGMSNLAAGDLTYRMSDDIPGEYRQLRDDFNAAMQQLEETMTVVAANTNGISTGADEIAQASDDLSKRTEQQAASLEETAAALDEITATVKKTASGAKQASDVVVAAKGEAEHSGKVVAEAVQAMGQIETSSQQISQIIGVIDEIAFQTNLLALNAGVEAARAGDAGRGFAVVASEVRALAQRSAEAAKEIKALISASSQQVGQGVNLVGETGKALQSIVTKVAEIDALVSEIAASAQEQSTGLAEVNTAVNQMDQVVQQNAAMVEQSTAATHSLRGEANELAQLIARFKTAGGQALAARPAPRQAPRPAAAHARPAPSPARALTRKVAASFGGAAAAAATDGWEEF